MKKSLYVILFLLIPVLSFGQEQTLISGKVENGGYGAPVVKFSTVKNHFAVFVGGYGGWLINHTFMIGGGGYGLASKIKGEQSAGLYYNFIDDIKIDFGYGGLVLEYIGQPDNLVHYSVSALIGAGGVSYSSYFLDAFTSGDYNDNHNAAVFVFEPGINAELNVTTFFRIDAGVSYRLVTGTDIAGLKNSDLGGPAAGLAFKFGAF